MLRKTKIRTLSSFNRPNRIGRLAKSFSLELNKFAFMVLVLVNFVSYAYYESISQIVRVKLGFLFPEFMFYFIYYNAK